MPDINAQKHRKNAVCNVFFVLGKYLYLASVAYAKKILVAMNGYLLVSTWRNW
jgi:hypothetical protein